MTSTTVTRAQAKAGRAAAAKAFTADLTAGATADAVLEAAVLAMTPDPDERTPEDIYDWAEYLSAELIQVAIAAVNAHLAAR